MTQNPHVKCAEYILYMYMLEICQHNTSLKYIYIQWGWNLSVQFTRVTSPSVYHVNY